MTSGQATAYGENISVGEGIPKFFLQDGRKDRTDTQQNTSIGINFRDYLGLTSRKMGLLVETLLDFWGTDGLDKSLWCPSRQMDSRERE